MVVLFVERTSCVADQKAIDKAQRAEAAATMLLREPATTAA